MTDAADDPILRLILDLRARVIRDLARLPEDLQDIDADLAQIEDAWVGERVRLKTQELTWDDMFE